MDEFRSQEEREEEEAPKRQWGRAFLRRLWGLLLTAVVVLGVSTAGACSVTGSPVEIVVLMLSIIISSSTISELFLKSKKVAHIVTSVMYFYINRLMPILYIVNGYVP